MPIHFSVLIRSVAAVLVHCSFNCSKFIRIIPYNFIQFWKGPPLRSFNYRCLRQARLTSSSTVRQPVHSLCRFQTVRSLIPLGSRCFSSRCSLPNESTRSAGLTDFGWKDRWKERRRSPFVLACFLISCNGRAKSKLKLILFLFIASSQCKVRAFRRTANKTAIQQLGCQPAERQEIINHPQITRKWWLSILIKNVDVSKI